MLQVAGHPIGIWDPLDETLPPKILEASVAVDGRENFGVAWFRNKFRDDPLGTAVVAYALNPPDGRVAGVVAFGFWNLLHDGIPIRGAVSYMTFVIPEFQRRGLFSALTRLALEETRRRGARLIFNFPNPNSRAGFLKLGWKDVGGIQTWLKAVRPLRVAAAAVAARGGIRVATAERVPVVDGGCPPEFERWSEWLDARRAWKGVWVGERTPAMLAARYARHPLFRYVLIEGDGAAAIVRPARRAGLEEAQILDLFFPVDCPAARIRRLFREIASRTGADVLTLLVSRGHPVRGCLAASGFVPVPNRISFFTRPLADDCPAADDRARWALSWSEIHMM